MSVFTTRNKRLPCVYVPAISTTPTNGQKLLHPTLCMQLSHMLQWLQTFTCPSNADDPIGEGITNKHNITKAENLPPLRISSIISCCFNLVTSFLSSAFSASSWSASACKYMQGIAAATTYNKTKSSPGYDLHTYRKSRIHCKKNKNNFV